MQLKIIDQNCLMSGFKSYQFSIHAAGLTIMRTNFNVSAPHSMKLKTFPELLGLLN